MCGWVKRVALIMMDERQVEEACATHRVLAHVKKDADGVWHEHLLNDHLLKVSRLAAGYAHAFGASEWAELAGLWHDFGKYSPRFQDNLTSTVIILVVLRYFLRGKAKPLLPTLPSFNFAFITPGTKTGGRFVPISRVGFFHLGGALESHSLRPG